MLIALASTCRSTCRPGSSALKVELHYEASGAALDLGCFGPTGFRGWSGGARRSFLITAKSATPGYLPGELEPGTWQVVLGLHRIPAAGVRYELTAEATNASAAALLGSDEQIEPPLTDRPPRRDLPAPPGLRWLAGDLHSHTVHSDGVLTVPELARFAAGRGLDFLAVTDHNTISHHRELPGRGGGLPDRPAARPGGHHRARSRERVRRPALDRLQGAARRLAGGRPSRQAACSRSIIPTAARSAGPRR